MTLQTEKLALTLGSAILSWGAIASSPTYAATVTYDFTTTVTSGSYKGQEYGGYFSYDNSQKNIGDDVFDPLWNPAKFFPTDFSFQFLDNKYRPKTYTLEDLVFATGRYGPLLHSYVQIDNPTLVENDPSDPFDNFYIPGDGEVENSKFHLTQDPYFGVTDFSFSFSGYPDQGEFSFLFSDIETNQFDSGSGTWQYSRRESVPEPTTIIASLVALGQGIFLKNKYKKSPQKRD